MCIQLKCLVLAIICVGSFPVSYGVNVGGVCNPMETNECPAMSTCSPRGCDGHVCLCDDGFVPTTDSTACKNAVDLGQSCSDFQNSLCKAAFSYCHPVTLQCECFPGYIPSLDFLRCKQGPLGSLSFALLGEPCGADSICTGLFVVCNTTLASPMCECGPPALYRAATDEEKAAEPFLNLECLPIDYQLDAVPENLVCAEEEEPLQANIDEKCFSFNNCPSNSDCLDRGCDGKVCVCESGYYSSEDKTTCLQALELGEVCGSNTTRCKGEGMKTMCSETSGKCECMETLEGRNGRCRLASSVIPPINVLRFSLLNENCGTSLYSGIYYTDVCSELFTTCMEGSCQCQTGFREATASERASDPARLSDCVPDNYSLVVDVLQCNLPIEPSTA